jgi:hypothetical protein
MAMDPQLSIKFEGGYKRNSCLFPYEDKLPLADAIIAEQAAALSATLQQQREASSAQPPLAGPSPVTITSMTEFLTMRARNVVPKYGAWCRELE